MAAEALGRVVWKQVHPIIARILAVVEGTSPAKIAEYLGHGGLESMLEPTRVNSDTTQRKMVSCKRKL